MLPLLGMFTNKNFYVKLSWISRLPWQICRSINPNPQDICRLYDKRRFSSYGEDDGKELFQKLQEAVDLYNKDGKGKAVLQWYDAGQDQAFTDDSCDTDEDELKLSKKKKAKKQRKYNTPMVLALCSPIMKRAHEHVQQSRDIAFVDATSSFDRLNNSIFCYQQLCQLVQCHWVLL